MKMYVHIGPHKTGTTYLQNLLLDNVDLLDRSGINYFNAGSNGRTNPHHQIAWFYGNNLAKHELNLSSSEIEKEIKDSVEKGKDIFITSEELSSFQQAVHRLKSIASIYWVEIIPIIVFRPQGDIINSAYCQRVKTYGLVKPFDEYFYTAISEPRYNYTKYYKSLFDEFDVMAFEYSREWVNDLCLKLSLNPRDMKNETIDVNSSLGPTQIEIIRMLSHIFNNTINFNVAVNAIRYVVSEDKKFWGLDHAQTEMLINTFGDINDKLEKKTGISLKACTKKDKATFSYEDADIRARKEILGYIEMIVHRINRNK